VDGKTLIDNVLRDHELLDPTDTENANVRLQIKNNAQRTIDEVELDWPWIHKVVTTTLALGTSGDVDLPANFQDFGHSGCVWIIPVGGGPDIPVFIRPLHVVQRLRHQYPAGLQNPAVCAVNGFNVTTKRKVLSFAPVPVAALTLSASFDRLPVTITDAVDPGSGMDLIPEAMHRTLIYEGTVRWQMKDKGDIRSATEQGALFAKALKQAKEAENAMRPQVLRMTPYPSAGFR
jgi:hypothetical protein